MKVLVADRDATLLAAIASTFGRHFDIVTASGRDECQDLLEARRFDLVVACDELTDYTGLELLSDVAHESPRTLKIFVASPSRLKRLDDRLSLFGLFRTLIYPVDPRKLLAALKFARDHLPTATLPANIRHVVLDDEWTTETGTWVPPNFAGTEEEPEFNETWVEGAIASNDAVPATYVPPPAPAVDEEVWADYAQRSDTTVTSAHDFPEPVIEEVWVSVPSAGLPNSYRLPAPFDQHAAASSSYSYELPKALVHGLQLSPSPLAVTLPLAEVLNLTQVPALVSSRDRAVARLTPTDDPLVRPAPMQETPTPESRPASTERTSTKRPPTRKAAVPTASQREAFQRALAKRNAAKSESAVSNLTGIRAERRGKWAMQMAKADVPADVSQATGSTGSLSDLARMALAPSSSRRFATIGMGVGMRSKRAFLLTGTGVAVALVAAVLSFRFLSADDPVARSQSTSAQNLPTFGAQPMRLVPTREEAARAPSLAPQPATAAPEQTPVAIPVQAAPVDPDTAPPDPPPPPWYERPGPMEPPSAMSRAPTPDGSDQ